MKDLAMNDLAMKDRPASARLLMTSGRGPAECRIALGNALAVMAKEACEAGLDLDVAHGGTPDKNGPASAIVLIEGTDAAAFARRWVGSILWVATSPVRPHHKRKNWFIGAFALPPLTTPAAAIAAGDLRFEAFAAGGPGGQHQNKTESAVRCIHVPSGLAVVARDGRSQHRNKALAIARLTELLALSEVLARKGEAGLVQASHDALERGNPVRRFAGPKFTPQ
jgi:peptide chain release factor